MIKPLLTEKATGLLAKNVYTFQVDEELNKHQVAKMLESLYKVKVADVKMAKKKGKMRRVGKQRIEKQLPDMKVAYVTLKEGTIDVFPKA